MNRLAEQTQGEGCARLTPGSGGIGLPGYLSHGGTSGSELSVTTESKGYDVARGSRLPGLFAPESLQ